MHDKRIIIYTLCDIQVISSLFCDLFSFNIFVFIVIANFFNFFEIRC